MVHTAYWGTHAPFLIPLSLSLCLWSWLWPLLLAGGSCGSICQANRSCFVPLLSIWGQCCRMPLVVKWLLSCKYVWEVPAELCRPGCLPLNYMDMITLLPAWSCRSALSIGIHIQTLYHGSIVLSISPSITLSYSFLSCVISNSKTYPSSLSPYQPSEAL